MASDVFYYLDSDMRNSDLQDNEEYTKKTKK